MASHRRPVSLETSVSRWRASACRAAPVFGGHPVEFANENAMEGFTKIVPLVGHLLAQMTRVGDNRPVRPSVGTMPGTTRPVGPDRCGGSLGRRHVCQGKKGGALVGPTQCGKGTKIMVLTDAQGTPLSVEIHSASPAEVTLIESLLDRRQLSRHPQRLIDDRAADSDPLRQRLSRQGLDLICPHRKNRRRPPLQDGRQLRRYRRRWKIERTRSGLQNFRRLVVRYEDHADLFLRFVQLACLIMTLRRF